MHINVDEIAEQEELWVEFPFVLVTGLLMQEEGCY